MVTTVSVPPLDPNAYTGPVRVMSGVARMATVTPDTVYGEFARWLYVGTAGAISIIKWDGTTQVIPALAAGVFHPIYSIGVNSVGTTASGIIWGS
jgi:hypothetical protein